MPSKLITNILFLSLTMISSSTFAMTELEKLVKAKFAGSYSPANPQSIKEILAACMKDDLSKQATSQKEKEICTALIKAEKYAQDSYKNYINGCAFRKMADSASLAPGFYDQYFINYLLKHKAIKLINTKNPSDLIKLDAYKNACMKELSRQLLPSFIKECKKENPYNAYYLTILNGGNP